ncbi:hypothetical protein GF358_04200 [Candidatus Woesearchaeota archaeon]|nr:hypothetical protein [Candidatus Woesearchaeota archaeon]
MKNIRLSMIILDVVAIIAILGVILLADVAEQREIAKMKAGQTTFSINKVVQTYEDRDNSCKKVFCPNTDPAEMTGWDREKDLVICQCGDGEVFYTPRV